MTVPFVPQLLVTSRRQCRHFTALVILLFSFLPIVIAAQTAKDKPQKTPRYPKATAAVDSERQEIPEQKEGPAPAELVGALNELVPASNAINNDYLRIKVQAEIADALWPWDETRARALFEKVIEELRQKNDASTAQTLIRFSQRFKVLNEVLKMVSARDGELALKYLKALEETKAPEKTESGVHPRHPSETQRTLPPFICDWLRFASCHQLRLDYIEGSVSYIYSGRRLGERSLLTTAHARAVLAMLALQSEPVVMTHRSCIASATYRDRIPTV